MANTTDRLYRMPIGDFLRRRPEAQTCQACGSPLTHGAVFRPSCRVLAAVNEALQAQGAQAAVGLVCVRPGQRVRAGAVIESASRSLRSGRPEMMGKPA